MSRLVELLRGAATRLDAAGVEEARLDAELLLAEALGTTRAHMLAHLDEPADAEIVRRFEGLLERRARHEPVAYILGRKEFFGLDLLVDRRVLIPRPETELLVEQALHWAREQLAPLPGGERGWGEGRPLIFDLATGSGAVAIALAANLPRVVSNIATDISDDALEVARLNAARHGVSERIRFVRSDLFENVEAHADLIVANLPYVSRLEWDGLAPDIREYEPRVALEGGADGLDAFRRFFAQAPAHLALGGAAMLEIGWSQAEAVRELALAAFPLAAVDVLKDGAGLDRVVVCQRGDDPRVSV